MSNQILLLAATVVISTFAGQHTATAQTTGKIAGKVTQTATGEPLIGANVLIEGTLQGATADIAGEYFILNVPPGTYTLRAGLVGFETVRMKGVSVSVNRTVEVDFHLKETAIETEEVVVTAERVALKKDQTSSVRNISSEQMELLPIETIDAVVNLQPGVVAGHFRGGRLEEVSYLVDGLQVDEAFGRGRAVTLEKEVISEIEVITGTFNAEYGNAMSGVVNAVTKDGGRALSGSASASYQSFLTSHSGIFQGLKASDFSSTRDYKMFLEGPILDETLTFMVNGRYQDVRGHLTGIRRFRVDDYSNFLSAVPSEWYSEHTGDEGVVPMNTNTNWSVFSKLSFQPSGTLRVSFSHSLSDGEYQYYNHYMKFNPDGRSTYRERAHMLALNLNHTLSSSLFHEVKASYTHSGSGDYLYEDPLDGRYVHDEYGRGTGAMFSTGGQYKSYSKRTIADLTGKYDITWQVNKHHTLKGGVLGVQHSINQYATSIQNRYAGTAQELEFVYDSVSAQRVYLYYEPIVYDPSVYTDRYTVRPREFSVYVQDKMEYEEMVINAGVRFDHFDPNTRYPSQPRNPSNQLSFPDNPEYMSTYEKAKPAWQLSPRFGLAYKLGEAALLRFAYGHFFQMPPLYAVYSNYNFLVPPTNYATTMGNPLLKPQKTIQYEVGLWQQLTRSMSLETAVFYRDIYDLLGTKVITTYNQIRYGLYTNLDYGNVMGLELKYEFVAGPLNAMLNYTLQYTRGNADNPTFTFSRAGSNQDPVNILIPMSWDQRHTLNVSVGYNAGGFGATITAYYNSGTPYTWRPIVESQLYRINLFPNNSPKPSQVSVDFSGYYNLWSFGGVDLRLTVLAYNLLDALNEIAVYSTSGRAYTDVVREIDVQGMRSDFATYYDYIHDPSMYGAPRSVKVGLGIQF